MSSVADFRRVSGRAADPGLRTRLIRLALVIPTLDQSGAERQLTLLAKGLPRDEFTVHVFALNRGGRYADELREAGIPVEVAGKRFRFDPLTWWRLRHGLRNDRPHVVQSFLFSANSYVRLPGVCPAGCRIVVSERCVDQWKSGWQLALDRRLLSRTDAMTANSESVARFYASVGIPRHLITVIPNGTPDVPPGGDREAVRRLPGLEGTRRIVGFAGRLARQKRLPDLIWAVQLLHLVVDDVKLVLIGDGPERDALSELAVNLGCRDKIVFAGHRPDAASLLSGCDVFCLPSEFEGMSNSLMEAMSAGVPVVVSAIDANRELVRHEQTGLVFPVGHAPELAKALRRILTDPDLGHRLSTAARELIRTQASVEKMVAAHADLYRRLVSGSASSAAP